MSVGIAYRYASLGRAVFPLAPRSKIPQIPKKDGGRGVHDATKDQAQIEEWWTRWPTANVGMACGPISGCWVLDVDPNTSQEGADWLAAKEAEHGPLPITPESKTLKGGRHILFRWDPEHPVGNRVGFVPGLDARGDGGYIVAPPSFVSERKDGTLWEGKYEWLAGRRMSEVEIAPAPEWLLNEVKKTKIAAPQEPFVPRERREGDGYRYGHKALDEECQLVRTAPPGQQDNQINLSSFRIGQLVGGGEIPRQDAEDALINAAMAIPGQSKKLSVIIDKVQRGMSAGQESPREAPKRPDRPMRQGKPELRVVGGSAKPKEHIDPETGEVTEEAAERAESWTDRAEWAMGLNWSLKEDGGLRPQAMENLKLVMEYHPGFANKISLNRFSYDVWIRGGLPCDSGEEPDREWTDNDDIAVAGWINRLGLMHGATTVRSVALLIASRQSFDPVEDYLTGLKWDGKPRIEKWLTRYAGADGTRYIHTIGPKFLISAVARVLEPGCKVDTMLVLEGPQGLKKSTLARALFGGEWFTDDVGDVTSKDSAIQIQGQWCVEVAEMDGFSRAEDKAVKAYLSKREDRYRPPYGRGAIRRPRRCVFVGTYNPDGSGLIKDATGARRYWFVKAREIDIEAIMEDRDQLWAEAVVRYRAHDQWWLTKDEERLAHEEQAARQTEDLWDGKVEDFLREKMPGQPFTNSDVVERALGIALDKRDYKVEKRVGAILTRLGCRHDRFVIEGKQKWAWAKKDPSEPEEEY